MQTELVTIKQVEEYGASYTNGLGADKSNFPNVKTGQVWEVITSEQDADFPNVQFPLGVIISTRLVKDV